MYKLKYTKAFEKGLKKLSAPEQKAVAQKLKTRFIHRSGQRKYKDLTMYLK